MRKWRKRPYWWLFRRFVRVAEFFIQSHATISDNLNNNLKQFGVRKPIEHIPTTIQHTERYEKIQHNVFTILYYLPIDGDRKFNEWLYGYDIFLKVIAHFPELKYIVVNGHNDMKYVYPYVDFFLRPNRHDAPSRMRMECDVQDIPYYWTQKGPSAEDAIKKIQMCLK